MAVQTSYMAVQTSYMAVQTFFMTVQTRQFCVRGWGGGGGGGLVAVTFLCDTSWENSIFLLKMFGRFGNILEKDIK